MTVSQQHEPRRIQTYVIALPKAIRADMRSNLPSILKVGAFLLAWAAISTLLFVCIEPASGSKLGEAPLDRLGNAAYLTIINLSTVGFGDIHPVSPWGKALAMFNAVLGVVAFAFWVAMFAAALQPGAPTDGRAADVDEEGSRLAASSAAGNATPRENTAANANAAASDEEPASVQDQVEAIKRVIEQIETTLKAGERTREYGNLLMRTGELLSNIPDVPPPPCQSTCADLAETPPGKTCRREGCYIRRPPGRL